MRVSAAGREREGGGWLAHAGRVEGGSGRAGAGAAAAARPRGSRVSPALPGPRRATSRSGRVRFCLLFVSPPVFLSPHPTARVSRLSVSVPLCVRSLSFCFFSPLPSCSVSLGLCLCLYVLSVSPFCPSGGVPLCLCISLTPPPNLDNPPVSEARAPPLGFMNSFLDPVKEAKPSPYLPPAPGAWPGSSPWN